MLQLFCRFFPASKIKKLIKICTLIIYCYITTAFFILRKWLLTLFSCIPCLPHMYVVSTLSCITRFSCLVFHGTNDNTDCRKQCNKSLEVEIQIILPMQSGFHSRIYLLLLHSQCTWKCFPLFSILHFAWRCQLYHSSTSAYWACSIIILSLIPTCSTDVYIVTFPLYCFSSSKNISFRLRHYKQPLFLFCKEKETCIKGKEIKDNIFPLLRWSIYLAFRSAWRCLKTVFLSVSCLFLSLCIYTVWYQ